MTNDELLNKIMKDSLVMRHELVADENAVFERLAKISNALRVVVELFDKAGKWAGQPVISVESLRNAIEKELL